MKRLIQGLVVVAGVISTLHQAWAEDRLRLENPRIVVEIDRETGALRSIRDKEQDVVYPQVGLGFEVVTTEGILRSEKALAVSAKAAHADLRFAGNGLEVALHYQLGADDHFIEKWLEIHASNGKPYFLKSVVLEDMTTRALSEIHFHDDQTICWHCPINLFLRGEKGGCFAGLEKYFIGVYRKEGIQRVSQGPYPGRGRSPLVNFSAELSQHFKGKKIPPVIEDVSLDWGEVWPMQEFMRHVLPNE